MRFEAQDFARCAGNPCFDYCKACKRNVFNSPVNPDAMRQWYMGPWIIEEERCPSFIAVSNSRSKEDV